MDSDATLGERLETYGSASHIQLIGARFEGNFAEIAQYCLLCLPLTRRNAVAEGFFVLGSFARPSHGRKAANGS